MNRDEAIKKLGHVPKAQYHISQLRQAKITKCSKDTYWYKDCIGKVFVVLTKPEQFEGIKNYRVIFQVEKFDKNKYTRGTRSVNLIEEDDCIIF